MWELGNFSPSPPCWFGPRGFTTSVENFQPIEKSHQCCGFTCSKTCTGRIEHSQLRYVTLVNVFCSCIVFVILWNYSSGHEPVI